MSSRLLHFFAFRISAYQFNFITLFCCYFPVGTGSPFTSAPVTATPSLLPVTAAPSSLPVTANPSSLLVTTTPSSLPVTTTPSSLPVTAAPQTSAPVLLIILLRIPPNMFIRFVYYL
jgi:hypothetical protein